MFNPYTAASAAVSYAAAQGASSANYSGYPTNLYPAAVTPAYGLVSYPAATDHVPYGNAVYGASSSSFTGLDAAVYSAATQLLHDRGLAPQSSAAASSGSSSSDALKRLESMNPILNTPSRSTRGGSGGGYRGGRGGAGMSYRERHGYPTKPKNPANAAVHYCETCKISCAGADSYQAHLIGTKHKKRDTQVKALEADKATATAAGGTPAAPPSNSRSSYRNRNSGVGVLCELCNIKTAGQAAYESHIKGKSHQKVLKLHMQLGKHIPENEPTISQRTVDTFMPGYAGQTTKLSSGSSICAKVVTGGKTVLITPKMNFVGGTILTTTGSGMQEVPAAAEPEAAATSTTPVDDVKPEEGTSKPETNGSSGSYRGRGGRFRGGHHRGPPPTPAAAKCSVNPNAVAMEPIGESYIEKTERTGKVAYYKCTLCNCEFSDESGMNSHIRGRRHRQEYKKKVDPSIHVEPQNSKKKQMERDALRNARPRGMMRGMKRPGPGGPPFKRHNGGPPPWSSHGPPHDDPYGPPPSGYAQGGYPPSDNYGPPPMQPPQNYGPSGPGYGGVPPYGQPSQGPPGHFGGQGPAGPPSMLGGPPTTAHLPFDQDESFEEVSPENRPRPAPQPPKLDQQYLLMKHRLITPSPRELESVTNALNTIERALKSITEKLTTENVNVASITDGILPAANEKLLKGSYRFGAMTKNLLSKDNLFGEILLIANKHPNAEVLNGVADTLKAELKAMTNHDYAVVAHVDQCGIFVKSLEPIGPGLLSDLQLPVWVYLAYGNLRDELFKQQQAAAEKVAAAVKSSSGEHMLVKFVQSPSATLNADGPQAAAPSTAPPTSNTLAASTDSQVASNSEANLANGLDLKRSLNVLAQSRRTRWFQEFISFFPQCRMLMRILNTICDKQADLRPLVGWPIEYLVITVLRLQSTYHGVAPVDIPLAEAFWMILSAMSSGVFLQGCSNGFKDPCERGNTDILGSLSAADRVKITKATGELVIRWVTGEYAEVLDVDLIKTDPLYVAPAPTESTTTPEVVIKQEEHMEKSSPETIVNGTVPEPMQVDG